MARRRFSRGGNFVRPPARSNVWIGAGFSVQTVAASSSVLLATYSASALALRPFTIVRTRLVIMFESDQDVGSERGQCVYTEQVVTQVATTAGIASVPTGITDTNADYYVYQPLFQRFRFKTAVGFAMHGNGLTWVVDSKAMRKVGVLDDIAVVIENRLATGNDIQVEGRQLVKLH